ncbi:hypothetical protein EDD92_7316 [Streptomyces sp. TLI_185]|nr:hypothetical protein EDD92_7316 [Streptomyces sp. TLI_185]
MPARPLGGGRSSGSWTALPSDSSTRRPGRAAAPAEGGVGPRQRRADLQGPGSCPSSRPTRSDNPSLCRRPVRRRPQGCPTWQKGGAKQHSGCERRCSKAGCRHTESSEEQRMSATDATTIPESRAPQQPAPGPPRRRNRKITVGSVRALVEERVGRSAPPPAGPADRRDRGHPHRHNAAVTPWPPVLPQGAAIAPGNVRGATARARASAPGAKRRAGRRAAAVRRWRPASAFARRLLLDGVDTEPRGGSEVETWSNDSVTSGQPMRNSILRICLRRQKGPAKQPAGRERRS